MRFATFVDVAAPDRPRVGLVVDDDRIVDLAAAAPDEPGFASMLDLIAAADRTLERARAIGDRASRFERAAVRRDEVRLLAPIPRLRKNVFCVGMNYPSHVEANARALGVRPDVGPVPLFFTKPPTAVVGPDAPIALDDRLTAKLDYEVELGIVVGRGGTWIDGNDALGHVFGYTIVNDVSARDLQWRTSQMFYGKGLDTYCPLGPWIVTPDELASGAAGPEVEVSCVVNGELRQRDSTSAMFFGVPRILAELSKGLTLEPGDVIATGTPGGCGYQLEPPVFLAPGDTVECRIAGIGSLRNVVEPVAATSEHPLGLTGAAR